MFPGPFRLVPCAAALALLGCGEDPPPPSPPARPPPKTAPAPAPEIEPYFREATEDGGLDFVHEVLAAGDYRIAEIMGPGCAVFDADGDGRLDLYFLNAGNGPRNGAANRYFRRTPDGRYADATASSGLGDRGFGTGVAVGDVDNDGDLDVYVGNWGADRLYLNGGAGNFRDVTEGSGLRGESLTSSVAFVDFDLDGFLDIYVAHYVDPDSRKGGKGPGKTQDYRGPHTFHHLPDKLYRNRGDGTFEDVSRKSGVGQARGSGLGVFVADLNGDGWPDVYVANDLVPNFLWINLRDGTFRNEATTLGAAYNATGAAESSMGVAVADVNGDARLDLLCTHLFGETNTLYLRRGDGFEDASGASNVGTASLPSTGWGVVLEDFDHDGDPDLAIANGGIRRAETVSGVGVAPPWDAYAERNLFLLHDGAGRYADRSQGAGGGFGTAIEVGRALAPADLDGDGDVDLVLTNIAGPARIYENVAQKQGRWLQVRALDPRLARDAFGARIVVRAGGREHVRVVGSATSYITSVVAPSHFGLGPAERVDELAVVWPGGDREVFEVEGVDRVVTVRRGDGK